MTHFVIYVRRIIAIAFSDYIFPFLGALILSGILFWPSISNGELPIATDILTGHHYPWADIKIEKITHPFPIKNIESFDAVRQNFPWKYLVIDQYKNGHWPLWNPTQLSGVPLAAEFIVGAFYPLNVIMMISNFTAMWGIFVMLQVCLAFITMYLFLRSNVLSKTASTFGSILFSISGFMAGFFYTGVVLHAFLWTPLILFGINKLFSTQNRLWIIVVGIATSLIGLASHLQMLVYALALSIVYISSKYYFQRNYNSLVYAVLGLVFGVLIASIQLFPAIELIFEGNRISNFGGNVDNILSPIHHLLLFWAPNFLGNPGNQNYFGGPSYFHEYSFYMGIPALFFGLIAVSNYRIRKSIFFWCNIVLISLVLVINNPLSDLPRILGIPLLGSITPTRIYGLTTLSLAVLASYGLDMFLQKKWLEVRKGLIMFIIAGTACISIIYLNSKFLGSIFLKYLYDTTPVNNLTSLRSLVLPTILFIITILSILLVLKIKKGFIIYPLLIFLVTINTGDLIRQFHLQNGFVPVESVFPQTMITNLLSSQSLPPRIVSLEDRILTPNFGAYYGWENIDGYQGNNINRYLETFAKLDAKSPDSLKVFSRMVSITDPKSPAIDLLGVNYVFSLYPLENVFGNSSYKFVATEGRVSMYENIDSIPRFSLSGEDYATVSDLDLMKSRQIVYGIQPDSSKIQVEEYEPNYISLSVFNNKDSQNLQTLIMNYHGWKVWVNSQPQNTISNDNGFMGVEVPHGLSQVKFAFDPLSFKIGLIVSISSLILLFMLPILVKVTNLFKHSH